jgi:metal-responsive CopG/Arc/MetJ family transcriptional regulator
MNRSIHFRVSESWFNLATARAEKLGLNLSEYIRSVVTKDVEEGRKLDQKYIWVLESPDSEHWDEKFAREEIARISQKWNVQVAPTSETRDQGHGLERVFIVQGKEEDINEFESELNEALY